MTPAELKYVLDQMYGFDIARKTRKREVVYAKKVYVRLLRDYGLKWIEMKHGIDLSHDHCIFHYKSFSAITSRDLNMYNSCIDYFKLPMEHIKSLNLIDGDPKLEAIISELKGLGRKDLKYFDDKVFKPFSRGLALEKSMMEPGYTGKRVEQF